MPYIVPADEKKDERYESRGRIKRTDAVSLSDARRLLLLEPRRMGLAEESTNKRRLDPYRVFLKSVHSTRRFIFVVIIILIRHTAPFYKRERVA